MTEEEAIKALRDILGDWANTMNGHVWDNPWKEWRDIETLQSIIAQFLPELWQKVLDDDDDEEERSLS